MNNINKDFSDMSDKDYELLLQFKKLFPEEQKLIRDIIDSFFDILLRL